MTVALTSDELLALECLVANAALDDDLVGMARDAAKLARRKAGGDSIAKPFETLAAKLANIKPVIRLGEYLEH